MANQRNHLPYLLSKIQKDTKSAMSNEQWYGEIPNNMASSTFQQSFLFKYL
jgi:hypothetical protein